MPETRKANGMGRRCRSLHEQRGILFAPQTVEVCVRLFANGFRLDNRMNGFDGIRRTRGYFCLFGSFSCCCLTDSVFSGKYN